MPLQAINKHRLIQAKTRSGSSKSHNQSANTFIKHNRCNIYARKDNYIISESGFRKDRGFVEKEGR